MLPTQALAGGLVQLAATHETHVPLQKPLLQSVAKPQVWPAPHAGHVPPPQSMSVSLPFLTPSRHVGAWHVMGDPAHT
jgi:hypothetical protein